MNRLRELRKSNKLSMKELGNLFGLAESTVSLYETGKRQPDFDTLTKLADYFNVSIDYLLGRDNAKKASSPNDEDAVNILKNPELAEIGDMLTALSPSQLEEVRRFVRYQRSLEAGEK